MDIVETEKILTAAEMFGIVGDELREKNAEIERLREALLDAVGFVSRADNLFLKKATTDTIKGIPDGYR